MHSPGAYARLRAPVRLDPRSSVRDETRADARVEILVERPHAELAAQSPGIDASRLAEEGECGGARLPEGLVAREQRRRGQTRDARDPQQPGAVALIAAVGDIVDPPVCARARAEIGRAH